jgi:hypothetical protein
VQDIPLAKIVGSVGRYQDFVQAFLPTNESMSDRWQSVAAAYLNPTSRGLPPIEVYQVGDCYFVRDGNHRVSVARHLKLPIIEAHVWEYLRPIAGLAPGVDIDTLLREAERSDFLEKTARCGSYHPLHGSWRLYDILGQIAPSQILTMVMGSMHRGDAWYDMIYETTVQSIEQAGVLNGFQSTAADFFIGSFDIIKNWKTL